MQIAQRGYLRLYAAGWALKTHISESLGMVMEESSGQPMESNEAEGVEPEEADESFPNADPESMELREPDPEADEPEPDEPDEADMFAADPKVDRRVRARTIRIMVWRVL